MKPSSFQKTIKNQFDYICKRTMEDERKDNLNSSSVNKQISKIDKEIY